jgi:hypothetical protein
MEVTLECVRILDMESRNMSSAESVERRISGIGALTAAGRDDLAAPVEEQ